MRIKRILLACVASLALAACSGNEPTNEEIEDIVDNMIYEGLKDDLQSELCSDPVWADSVACNE